MRLNVCRKKDNNQLLKLGKRNPLKSEKFVKTIWNILTFIMAHSLHDTYQLNKLNDYSTTWTRTLLAIQLLSETAEKVYQSKSQKS